MLKRIYRNYTSEKTQLLVDSIRRNRVVYKDVMNEKKLIFIHIPKAAGTAIANEVFEGVQPGHFKWHDYEFISRCKFEEYFKFSFVRNPFDRFVSAFHYLQNGGGNKFDREFSVKHGFNEMIFSDFIDKFLSEKEVQRWIHFIPQNEFIHSDKKGLVVDFLGRVESIEEDMMQLRNLLEIPQKIMKKENISNHDSYRVYYNDDDVVKVSEFYNKDLEIFNYDF